MKLSHWASVAEIVSGIAVVVTLVFLVLGIRENTQVTRASMYSDLMDGLNEYSMAIADNPDLSRIWLAFMSFETEDLDPSDFPRLTNIVQTMFRNWESAWYSRRYGVMGEEEWARVERLLCPGWERSQSADVGLRSFLTEPFFHYIETNCHTPAE